METQEVTAPAIHPKKAEADARKVAKQTEYAAMMSARALLIAAIQPNFLHIPPDGRNPGMTIAWIADRRNIIAVSTALCHPKDNFSKKVGEAYAARSMAQGQAVKLRVPTGVTVRNFLLTTFAPW